MDVYHPSKSAVDNSKNGMQLLNNLLIPSLSVSDALGSITAAGQSVQVRINGRTATIDQVRALLPETIKRVEWMDNPGLRYGGANTTAGAVTPRYNFPIGDLSSVPNTVMPSATCGAKKSVGART